MQTEIMMRGGEGVMGFSSKRFPFIFLFFSFLFGNRTDVYRSSSTEGGVQTHYTHARDGLSRGTYPLSVTTVKKQVRTRVL